jgi:pyrroloquinoline quinone (PQQ) biosynthesis protein C
MTETLGQRLDREADQIVSAIEGHPLFVVLSSAETEDRMLLAGLRNVLLSIHFYGPFLTRALFQTVGRLASKDQTTARQLADLVFEETSHPGMAYRDYLKMGGNPAIDQESLHSPSAFAVAAVADQLARHENPYAAIGFLYLLESTTPRILELFASSPRLRPIVESFGFLSLHRTEDVGHSEMLRRLIDDIGARDPEAAEAIAFGYKCFSIVYPSPIWSEALAHARRDLSAAGG